MRDMASAENRNDAAFRRNAHRYPNAAAANPPASVPTVCVVHSVTWVSEFAVWMCSRPATAGRMEARPLVKNGEANIKAALKGNTSHSLPGVSAKTNSTAAAARNKSLAIMTRLRSHRSSSTPATGPASIAGTARASITALSASPEPVVCTTRLKTAMLLK